MVKHSQLAKSSKTVKVFPLKHLIVYGIILEVITLAIMCLVLTSNHLFVSWHHYQVSPEDFILKNNQISFPRGQTNNGHLIEKAITFERRGIPTFK